jgi:hypothetical protein
MDERIDDAVATAPSINMQQADSARVGRSSLAVAGLAGLTYWFTGWASFPDGPAISTATAQQVRDHVTTTAGAIQGATIAGMIGVAASVVFLAAIVRQVRDRLPASLLADVVLGAGILLIAYQWLMVTAEGLPRLLPNLLDSVDLAEVNDQTVLSWYALTGFTHFLGDLAIVPTVVLIGAFSLAARRGQLLPAWLVWVGLAIAVAGVVGMVAVLGELSIIYPFWFVGLIGYFFWILAVSVTFLIRLRRYRRVAVAG